MAIDLETLINPENVNLAEFVDQDTLTKIGEELKNGYDVDNESRKDWLEENEGWMKLATQYKETKTFPWVNAANVKYPLVTTAAMQFSARAYPALIPTKKPVKSVIIGQETEELNSMSAAIGEHMSYQLMYEMQDWEEDMDRLCIILPITGTVFKKTYYNPLYKQNISELVLAKDLVINYWAKNVETASRVSHVIELNKNDVETRKRAGIFLDIDFGTPDLPQRSDGSKDISRMERPSKIDDSTPYTFVECHTYWDLDEDGYAEPYIITFEYKSGQVARIIPRFYGDDITWSDDEGKNKKIIEIKPIQYFTKFGFIPNPDGGFYDLGFGLLLGPINETINTSINQLLDAGTMSTLQAGFLSKGIRIRGGEYRMAPNEWKVVNANVDDLRKAIYPLPVKEPSPVLFQLLGSLVQSGEKLASIAEIFVGKMPGQNTPATTTLETVKQGMAVFTAIYKRIYRSLDKEYKRLFKLNSLFLDDKIDYPVELTRTAYQQAKLTVVPTADPDAATDAEKLVKAQALMELAKSGLVNPQEATKRLLLAMRIEGVEALMQLPPPQPDPEVQKMQMEMQLKEREAQLKEQIAQAKLQIDQLKAELKVQMEQLKAQNEQQKHERDMAHQEEMHQLQMQITQREAALDAMIKQRDAVIEERIRIAQAETEKKINAQEERHLAAMNRLKESQKKKEVNSTNNQE